MTWLGLVDVPPKYCLSFDAIKILVDEFSLACSIKKSHASRALLVSWKF
jgi:hypothetical protein